MKRTLLTLIAISSLAACVSAPTGPTIAIMPREGKPFEVFQQEDQQCREFAANAIKDTSNAALKEGATSAMIGAALGAAAGFAWTSYKGKDAKSKLVYTLGGAVLGLLAGRLVTKRKDITIKGNGMKAEIEKFELLSYTTGFDVTNTLFKDNKPYYLIR
jgi:hypothetical protein